MAFHNPVSQTTSTPSILTSAGTVLARNDDRNGFIIQNLGTNPLFVLFGSGASASVFNLVLKGATAPDDGTGGSVAQEDGVIYCGIITVSGTSPRFVVTEF